MIYIEPAVYDQPVCRQKLVEKLEQFAPAFLANSPDQAEQILLSLEDYCSEMKVRPTSDDDYTTLIARALWSIGCEPEAHNALLANETIPYDENRRTNRNLMMLRYHRLLKQTKWISIDTRPGWVLCLDRIAFDKETLELSCFSCIKRMLDSSIEVWEQSSGDGWLGIKGLSYFSSQLHAHQPKKDRESLKERLLQYTNDILSWHASMRTWKKTPEVKILS